MHRYIGWMEGRNQCRNEPTRRGTLANSRSISFRRNSGSTLYSRNSRCPFLWHDEPREDYCTEVGYIGMVRSNHRAWIVVALSFRRQRGIAGYAVPWTKDFASPLPGCAKDGFAVLSNPHDQRTVGSIRSTLAARQTGSKGSRSRVSVWSRRRVK